MSLMTPLLFMHIHLPAYHVKFLIIFGIFGASLTLHAGEVYGAQVHSNRDFSAPLDRHRSNFARPPIGC